MKSTKTAIALRLTVTCLVLLATSVLMTGAPRRARAQQSIIYVNRNASGKTHNGQSWATAYLTLQDALVTAGDGYEIWVAKGVYYPDEGGGRQNNEPGESFGLYYTLEIYGGFVGNETSRNQRNWTNNVTVLSGDIDKNDDVNSNGVTLHPSAVNGVNARRVVYNEKSLVDGFTITGAYGDAEASYGGGMGMDHGALSHIMFIGNYANRGGGLYTDGAYTLSDVSFISNQSRLAGGGLHSLGEGAIKGQLTDVIFKGNTAGWSGGGMFVNTQVAMTNVTFDGNQTDDAGGAICNDGILTINGGVIKNNVATDNGGGISLWSDEDNSATITDLDIANNTAGKSGGGIYNESNLTITGGHIVNNVANGSGGAMMITNGGDNSCSAVIDDVEIEDNTAGGQGGGIYLRRETRTSPCELVKIANGTLFRNKAGSSGGGMSILNADPALTNMMIAYNHTGDSGGGISNLTSNPVLINVTVYDNIADNRAGGLSNRDQSRPSLTNVSFSRNQASKGGAMYNATDSHPTLVNCILWGDKSNNNTNEIYNQSGCSAAVTYSDVKGGYTGAGNINADPKYVNADNGNLLLYSDSPAVNTGRNAAVTVSIDVAGRPRIVYNTVDMGAYEVQ